MSLFVFIASYLAWTLIVAHFGGFWVYPIFKVLGQVQRIVFMLFCSMFGGFLYILGEALNNLVWSKYSHMAKEDIYGKLNLKEKGKEPQKTD